MTADNRPLAQGKISPLGTRWYHVGFTVARGTLFVDWNGQKLTEQKGGTFSQGVVALGTGWNQAIFDNLKVKAQ